MIGNRTTRPEPAKRRSSLQPPFLAVVLTACSLSAAIFGAGMTAVRAADWPARPGKVVVPYGPGGIADVFGRITADRLTKVLGKPFVVESRGGAAGAIGTEYVVRSPPDGYTLYFAGGAQFSVLPLMHKLPYDPIKE